MSCARNCEKARAAARGSDTRSKGESSAWTASAPAASLDPAAATEPRAVSVSARADPAQQDEDGGDDADDGRKAEGQAQRVDECSDENRDQDADHEALLLGVVRAPAVDSGWAGCAGPGFPVLSRR